MSRHLLTIAIAALALGCAKTPPPSAPTATSKAKTTAPRTDIRAFAFSEPGMMAYLKARELARLPGYDDWLETHPEAQRVNALFEQLRAGCSLDPFEVVDEVLFTVVDDRLIGAVRVRLGENEVFSCLGKLVDGGTRMEIEGRPTLLAPDRSIVMTLVDDILLFGDEATVRERLRSHAGYDGRISPSLPDLRNLVAFARIEAEGGAINAVESRFIRNGDRLEMSVRLRSPSPEDADWVVNAMRLSLDREIAALLRQLPQDAQPSATNLLEGARLSRRVGQAVDLALPVEALAEGQILLVALVDRLGEAMVRRQRIEEARMVLEILAVRMAGHAQSNSKAGHPSFVASAPQTPEKVPTGTDGEPSPADWSHETWRTLGFEPPVGLAHAFAIDTARDGRATTIRAVADLDGDGETSVLELPLSVEGEAITIGDIAVRGDEE